MGTNTENKNELALPLIFGSAFGFLVSPLASPVVGLAAFAVGAGFGFWFDKKQDTPTKPKEEGPLESSAKKSICH